MHQRLSAIVPVRHALFLLALISLLFVLSLQSATYANTNSGVPDSSAPEQFFMPQAYIQTARIVGDRIIYTANFDQAERLDLYSAPLAGGPPIRLTGSLPFGDIESIHTTDERIVFAYWVRSWEINRRYVYSVPVAGGELTQLGPNYPDSNLQLGSQLIFGISPDGTRVVYLVDLEQFNAFRLFSVPISGGATVELNAPLPPMGSTPGQVSGFSFTPDSRQVVYRALPVVDNSIGSLHSVPIAGGPVTHLVTGVDRANEIISPDSAYVVYTSGTGLYSVPVNGSNPPTLIDSGRFFNAVITADSTRIIYGHTDEATSTNTIRSAPIAGGASQTLASGINSIGDRSFYMAPDSSVLFYNDQTNAFFVVPVSGGTPNKLLDTPVYGHIFSPDSAFMVMEVGNFNDKQLYRYAIATGELQRLDDPNINTGGTPFLSHIINDVVFFIISRPEINNLQIASIPLAGGATRILTEPFGPTENRIGIQFINDTHMLITTRQQDFNPRVWQHVYVMPVDGSTPPRRVDQVRWATPNPTTVFLPVLQN
jgi:hypothetical protein